MSGLQKKPRKPTFILYEAGGCTKVRLMNDHLTFFKDGTTVKKVPVTRENKKESLTFKLRNGDAIRRSTFPTK